MFAFWFYRYATHILGPLLPLLLWFRQLKGKEDPLRRGERKGSATIVRPKGHLIWVHVASVGESLSVLPLVSEILVKSPTSHILVTSTTVTSAAVMAKRLPARAFHQYIPVDRPSWVKKFFDTWQPDLGLIVESELWPNLLFEAKQRKQPMVLVNGRMSKRSADRWMKFPGFIQHLLNSFELCLVQDPEQVERYTKLGAKKAVAAGNLKLVDNRNTSAKRETNLKLDLDKRLVWLAASTHDGEEPLIVELHQRLIKRIPSLLTVLAPRHPIRTPDVIEILQQNELQFVTRTSGASLEDDHELFLVDTIGELTEFFHHAQVSLICGSLIPGIGGHNPVEGAQRGTAIVLGQYMDNFKVLTKDFLQAGAAAQEFSIVDLEDRIFNLLTDATKREQQVQNATRFLKTHENILASIMTQLDPYLQIQEKF